MAMHKEEIIRLYKEGKSYREIQKILGCSKGTISYHLGEGQKQKTQKRARDKRGEIKKYIQEYKHNHCCSDCKENFPYWIMEFDHLRDKEFNLSSFSLKTASLEKVKEEIKKCEVVCSNCHKNRTYIRLYHNGSNSLDISEYYNI